MGWFLVRGGPFLGQSVHRIRDRLNGVVCAYGRERLCSDGNVRGFGKRGGEALRIPICAS